MNWYKLSQLSDIEIFEDFEEHQTPYTEIGHGEHYINRGGKLYDKEHPNYMWIYYMGDIMSKEETKEEPGHYTFMGYDYKYGGRFESATGKLSVHRPTDSSGQFTPIPKSILYKLYQKFPGVKQIYVF